MFVAVALSALALPAQADQKLTLIQGAVGNDRAFIKQFVDKILRDYGRKLDRWNVYVGKADITRDGEPELFVYLSDFGECGTSGCHTYIFRKASGEWAEFTGLSVQGEASDSRSEKSLYLRDEGAPYLTIYSVYSGLRWSDKIKDYDWFCISPCPSG